MLLVVSHLDNIHIQGSYPEISMSPRAAGLTSMLAA
jgi:hypothetical protein